MQIFVIKIIVLVPGFGMRYIRLDNYCKEWPTITNTNWKTINLACFLVFEL